MKNGIEGWVRQLNSAVYGVATFNNKVIIRKKENKENDGFVVGF